MKVLTAKNVRLKNGKLSISDKSATFKEPAVKASLATVPMEFDYKTAGIPVINGVLTVPERYNEVALDEIAQIEDLVKLNILGKLDFMGEFDIETNPNLKTVNFVHPIARDFGGYKGCYSLESVTINGEIFPTKACSAGIVGFVKGVYEQHPYTIYSATGAKFFDNIPGLDLVFVGTVINGFEYTGIGFVDSITDEVDAKESAIYDVRLRIKKHIAPQLYFNEGSYASRVQEALLNKIWMIC